MTLKASTNAMRKAGITLGVQEVESVMTELDVQMREVQDVTEVLANPLNTLSAEEEDLDAELELLEAMGSGPEEIPPLALPPALVQAEALENRMVVVETPAVPAG
jgi:hypothetical protein